MFNNLIESSSHRNEFKRRGLFFLFTTASYALLFALAGVASIYAYDARLEDRNLEVVTLLSPADFPILHETPAPTSGSPRNDNRSRQLFDERRIALLSVNRPDVPPKEISTSRNPDIPVRDGVTTLITGRDRDADLDGGPLGLGRTGAAPIGNPVTVVTDVRPPPPAPEPKPSPKILRKKVINSEALSLPKPPYPPIAKQARIQGKVSVQVLIDETGKVISSRAVDGSPLLVPAAERAAFQARFSPTMIGDQPVKVSGIITYNFVLQ